MTNGMNKRIRELEKQATETVKCGLNGTHTALSFNRKKFAELIVRECAQLVQGVPVDTLGYHTADQKIKEYFGVEE
jgi:hypothetical protein